MRDAEKIGESEDGGERHAHFAGKFLQFSMGLAASLRGPGPGGTQLIAQLLDLSGGPLQLALPWMGVLGHDGFVQTAICNPEDSSENSYFNFLDISMSRRIFVLWVE